LAFRVAARTILELGAELISSDAVAIYELVKNAIDAGSPDGVTIEFGIALRHSDYIDALNRIDLALMQTERRERAEHARILTEIQTAILEQLLPDAPRDARKAITQAVEGAESLKDLRGALSDAYNENNWIEFRDTGRGMSRQDLLDAYLVIGTPSRKRAVEAAVGSAREVPFLGEKGVGRLSVMRLGSGLHVRTATSSDKRFNVLDIDWSDFEDLDKLVGDIAIAPSTAGAKPTADFSGTTIRVTDLQASWSPGRIQEIAITELARLSDPFSRSKRRFRLLVLFNGARVDIPRLDRAILDLAHATAKGHYEIIDGRPQLTIDLWSGDLGKGNPPEEKRIFLERVDLRSLLLDPGRLELPSSALTTVGPFSFELYWYNRKNLRSVDSIGDRQRILRLQQLWSGIMLFRNGYRVFPYGDEADDWLGLDRRALGSGGYKLNKLQFIGRVAIGRAENPRLVDQTNREGLKDCDDKQVLMEVLKFAIHNRLKHFLDDIEKRHTHVELDFDETEKRIKNLERRAQATIRELERRHSTARPQLRELLELFEEMRVYFASAKDRAEEIEDERDRMIQLAGVGLMLEVVAHELARSTEHTMRIIDEASPDELPTAVASLFSTLRDEIKTMNKRLRVLDPLSITARQRKETFDFVELVQEVFEGHAAQFRRHGIKTEITIAAGRKSIRVNGVRGMFVQILENLIQNSVYWLNLRGEDEDDFKPRIEVTLAAAPHLMEFFDNGPGIQPSLRDEVFKAFFSTKGKSRRQGLGLYIARDCATHHGGQLYLSDERRPHKTRLNTFVLEIPKGDE
jgi:signal transduction histidine kinase